MSACQVILPQPLPANVLPLVLPFVWAIGGRLPVGHESPRPHLHVLRPDFYRKYTEALLRRYVRMSMEAGKVPSLIGQEMFRGKVTRYRVASFDDVVIFVADIDRCLQRLAEEHRIVLEHMALQQFTVRETAKLMHIPPMSVIRMYGPALDELTRIFLEARILEPIKTCQEWMEEGLSLTI